MSSEQTGDSGLETLYLLSNAEGLNAWIWERIQKFIRFPVIEIGSGIGNISQYLCRHCDDIVLSDYKEEYILSLKKTFSACNSIRSIEKIDLSDGLFDQNYKHLFSRFNSLVMINVLEHVKNDKTAMQNAFKLLNTGGHLIVLVPSSPLLFNSLDQMLGHERRYTSDSLMSLFNDLSHTKLEFHYFNFLGALGWFISGRILQYKTLKSWQVSVFEKLVPIGKLLDSILKHKFGLSIIAVVKKD